MNKLKSQQNFIFELIHDLKNEKDIIHKLNNFLEKEVLSQTTAELLLGVFYYHDMKLGISVINNHIEQKHLYVNSEKIVRELYCAECRDQSDKNKDCCISFMDFNDVKHEYMEKYSDIMNRY